MTVDPPRRLRPRAPQRRNTVDKTKGAPSAKGTTAAARPVTTGHRAQQYVPPVSRVEIVVGDTTGQTDAIAISRTTGTGPDSTASNTDAVAIGFGSSAPGYKSVAIGSAASTPGASGIAIGQHSTAAAQDSIAIGNGVTASNVDDCMIGTANSNVQIMGALILSDSLGGQWQIVVSTGGALSTVAYP